MIRTFLQSLCLAVILFQLNLQGQEHSAISSDSATRSDHSISDRSFEELGKVVDKFIEENRTVGAELLVIQKDHVLFHQSFGFSDKEQERKWENNTFCNIRSMTKPITSAAAQILIDRKQLNLDDPVAKYLESFDNDKSRAVTVRQVLSHRSGLPLTNLIQPNQYQDLSKQVASSGKWGPNFKPDSKFWYSDSGTDVVGALVEKVSGELLNEFVTREILKPLDMTDTFYGIAGSETQLAQAASLYIKNKSKGWIRFWKANDKPIYPFAWGSQTIYSTTTDYAKFLKMMMNNGRVGDQQLLSEEAVERMLEPISRLTMMGSDKLFPTGFRNLEVFYGQMMVTHRTIGKTNEKPVIIGHSGSDGTNAWAWPERDLVVVYFTQSRGGVTPLRIEAPIDRWIIHAGKNELAPQKLRPYVGTYIANYGNFDNEEFKVDARNGKLFLDVPSQMVFELVDADEGGYWAFAIAPNEVKATFDRTEDGEVVGLKLHKAGKVYEVPRQGTARAKELSQKKKRQRQNHSPDAGDQQGQGVITTWKGTLEVGEAKLRLEIDIVEDGSQLAGELRSLDQNNAKLKVAKVKMEKDGLSFAIPQIGATFSGKYEEDGAVVKGTFSQSGAEFPLTLNKAETKNIDSTTKETAKEQLKEAWVGELEMGVMKPVMQFRIVTKESGESGAYFDSVTEGQTGFEATWSIEGDELKFDVAEIRLTFRGKLNEDRDTAEGTWKQGGRSLPLTLKKQKTEYDSVNVWENRPQRPVEPFPYDIEEVKFENDTDDVTLAGTLTIPKKKGRHPVVVLISGSGPQDRDESLMEHKPFLVLADYLTRRGIAVLRYDDRGTAESTGNFGSATSEDFARDAAAAVEFLKTHDRINSEEIGLAGHSEGGLVAPMVTGLRDDVAFVALLAATGVDGAKIITSQTEAMLRAEGTPESEIEVAMIISRTVTEVAAKADLDEFEELLEQAVEDAIKTLPETTTEETVAEIRAQIPEMKNRLQQKWLRFFLSYDPRPALRSMKCPVLAIIGSKDVQVLPDLNMPEIEKALTEGGNNDFEIVIVPNLNHLFQECETGALSEYATIQETFNPEALEKIGDWIIQHCTIVK